jgi:hypothetical protein
VGNGSGLRSGPPPRFETSLKFASFQSRPVM